MKVLLLGLCLLVTTLGIVLHAAEPVVPQSRVIILLGPPGSGKGTQAVRISKELQIPHISTGDLFRENLSKGTELGKKVKAFMDSGKLVPDDLVLDMLFDRVSRPDCENGYLLDGFPRTIPQAEALDKYLKDRSRLVVLNLNVADDVIVKRAEGRLTCKNCGHIHNRYFAPPKEDGKCDKCGGELFQRPDDAAAVVEARLKVYHDQTEPLVAFYSNKSVLVNFDGEQPPEKVFHQIMDLLNKSKGK